MFHAPTQNINTLIPSIFSIITIYKYIILHAESQEFPKRRPREELQEGIIIRKSIVVSRKNWKGDRGRDAAAAKNVAGLGG